MPDLEGKVVAVTDAARGMGRAHVRGFLAAGARVAAMDQSWEPTGFWSDTDDAFRRALQVQPDDVVIASGLTGTCFDAMAWNLEHGLDGREAWIDPEVSLE